MDVQAHEYVIDISPAALHGSGVLGLLSRIVSFASFIVQMIMMSLSGHSRSYILAAIESSYTTSCRPIVTFALSSAVSEILRVLYADSLLALTDALHCNA